MVAPAMVKAVPEQSGHLRVLASFEAGGLGLDGRLRFIAKGDG